MKKILIVEDDVDSLYLLKFFLEKNGYHVFATQLGKEGVKLAKKEIPDLILMDIQLPDISREEATKILRQTKELENTPIIAVTAHAMPGDRERIYSVGHNCYIEKPIEPENVLKEINKFI